VRDVKRRDRLLLICALAMTPHVGAEPACAFIAAGLSWGK
jgi:hypothetical protein